MRSRQRTMTGVLPLDAVLEAYAMANYSHHRGEVHHRHLADPVLAMLLQRGGHLTGPMRSFGA